VDKSRAVLEKARATGERAAMIELTKRVLRRYLAHPRLYALGRRIMLVGQYHLRRPDEPDFRIFPVIAPDAHLAVDVGANGGQSAVAFAFLLPEVQIVSFEPNPALWPDLDFIARLLGARFSFRKTGLGPQDDTITLQVPHLGKLPITTRASLSAEAAAEHQERLRREVGRDVSLQPVEVQVTTFDSHNLDPDIVKIDVEGYELQVLEGMKETLARSRPVMMLEANEKDQQCQALLASLGYEFCGYDDVSNTLVSLEQGKTRNWFAIPQETSKSEA